MPQIDILAHEIARELKKGTADYLEARFEESESSQISYRGKELESIGR